jgi:MFS family permease
VSASNIGHFPDGPIPGCSRPEPAFQAQTLLVASYGAVQALISPAFGKVIDLYGYAPLAIAASLAPLAACAVLWGTRSVE